MRDREPAAPAAEEEAVTARATEAPAGGSIAALQRAAGNRAVGAALRGASAPPLPSPPGARRLAREVRRLSRAPVKTGPAATIPADRGDVERGYYSVTERVTYGVRASGPDKPEGLWVDHLFDSRTAAEAYARQLAAAGAPAIRETSALPHAWPAKSAGGAPVPGNAVLNVYVIEVPAGTPTISGVVRSQPESSTTPGLPSAYAGGGPQTVISWEAKTRAVAVFPVAGAITPPSHQLGPGPAPPSAPPAPIAPAKPYAGPVPPPVLATDDPRAVAALYGPKLVDRYRSAAILRMFSQAALDGVEEDESAYSALGLPVPPENAARKALLTAQVAAAEAQQVQAREDYELITRPDATAKSIQEMLARRGVAVAANAQHDASGAAALQGSGTSAWSLSDKGLAKQGTTGTTRTVLGPDGKPVAISDEETDAITYGLWNRTQSAATKTTVVSGDTARTAEEKKTTSVDLTKGQVTIDKTSTAERKDASGYTTKSVDSRSQTYGVGGVTSTRSTSEQVGDVVYGSSTTKGFKRGDGEVSVTTSSTKTQGQVDAEGKLVKGSATTKSASGGLVSDPEKGVGIGGTGAVENKQALGGGKEITSKADVKGRWYVDVKQIEGSDPPRFQIVTTINLSVSLGGGASKEFEAGKTKGEGSLAVTGSAQATFKRNLSAADAKGYLEAMQQNGGGGRLPEHQLLHVGATQSWRDAQNLWAAMTSGAEAAAQLKEDESFELVKEGGVEGKLGGSTTPGGGSTAFGGDLGITRKRRITIIPAGLKDGRIKLTAKVEDEGGESAGATVSEGVASGKVGLEWSHEKGSAVSFVLDPKASGYAERYAAITAAETPEDITRLAAKYPELLDERTESSGEGTGTKVGIGVAGIDLEGGSTAKTSKAVTTDKEGKKSYVITGENKQSASVAAGGMKYTDSTTQKYVGEVDKAGKAKGDLSETRTRSSAGKTAEAIWNAATNDPLSLVTQGPSKMVKDESKTEGVLTDDDDLTKIVAESTDKKTWDKHVVGRNSDDWQATRRKLAATVKRKPDGTPDLTPDGKLQYDRVAAQEALAAWTGDEDGDRKEALDITLRGTHGQDRSHGKVYELPDGLSHLKAPYKSLVAEDPFADADGKLAAGKAQEALTDFKALSGKLQSFSNELHVQEPKFENPSAFLEMASRATERINECQTRIRKAQRAVAGPAKPPVALPPPGVTTVPTADQKAAMDEAAQEKLEARNAAVGEYNNWLGLFRQYRDNVQKAVGQAEAELNRTFFGPDWGLCLKRLREARNDLDAWTALHQKAWGYMEKWGFDRGVLEGYHPAGTEAYWKTVDGRTRDKSMSR